MEISKRIYLTLPFKNQGRLLYLFKAQLKNLYDDDGKDFREAGGGVHRAGTVLLTGSQAHGEWRVYVRE